MLMLCVGQSTMHVMPSQLSLPRVSEQHGVFHATDENVNTYPD